MMLRFVLFLLSIFMAMAVLNGPSNAQNYPWCAIYSGGMGGGGTNCGFTTFEQCMETARGLVACANRTHNISLLQDHTH